MKEDIRAEAESSIFLPCFFMFIFVSYFDVVGVYSLFICSLVLYLPKPLEPPDFLGGEGKGEVR